MHAHAQADLVQDFGCIQRVGGQAGCQLDIFQSRQVLHKVVELKDKADVKTAVVGQLFFIEPVYPPFINDDFA